MFCPEAFTWSETTRIIFEKSLGPILARWIGEEDAHTPERGMLQRFNYRSSECLSIRGFEVTSSGWLCITLLSCRWHMIEILTSGHHVQWYRLIQIVHANAHTLLTVAEPFLSTTRIHLSTGTRAIRTVLHSHTSFTRAICLVRAKVFDLVRQVKSLQQHNLYMMSQMRSEQQQLCKIRDEPVRRVGDWACFTDGLGSGFAVMIQRSNRVLALQLKIVLRLWFAKYVFLRISLVLCVNQAICLKLSRHFQSHSVFHVQCAN